MRGNQPVKLTAPKLTKPTPHELLNFIFSEATTNMRRAKDEKERYYWQGKKDGVRMAQALFAESENEAHTLLRWQITSDNYNAPKNRYTRTEDKVYDEQLR